MTNVPRRDTERAAEGPVERGQKLGAGSFRRPRKHPPLEEARRALAQSLWREHGHRVHGGLRQQLPAAHTGIPGVLCFALLSFADNKLLYRLKVWGSPASSKSAGAVFLTAFAHSGAHFDNSPAISNLFIIIKCVVAACNH